MSQIEDLENRIALLEAQLEELKIKLDQTDYRGTTLIAPVRVNDTKGNLLAEIVSESNNTGIRFFNANNKVAITIGVDGTNGGYLAVRNSEGQLLGLLDIEQYGARLLLEGHGKDSGVLISGCESDGLGGFIKVIPKGDGEGVEIAITEQGGEISICNNSNSDSPAILLRNVKNTGQIKTYSKAGKKTSAFPKRKKM